MSPWLTGLLSHPFIPSEEPPSLGAAVCKAVGKTKALFLSWRIACPVLSVCRLL